MAAGSEDEERLGRRPEAGSDATAPDPGGPEVLRGTGEPEGGDDLTGRAPDNCVVGVLAADQPFDRALDPPLRPSEIVVRLGLEVASL
jgi:hypothetical protein